MRDAVRFLALTTLTLLLAAPLAGCPDDDDDSAVPPGDDDAGDDDTVDDDDTGDDDAGDDDAGDDDDAAVDYPDATVPDFAGCTGNQVTFVLGDGSAIGPFDGFQADSSFANCFPQFKILIGEGDGKGDTWAGLIGNYEGMSPGEIPFQTPASEAGHVVLTVQIPAEAIGDLPADLAGNYGFANFNLQPQVGGSVTFAGSVPGPGVAVTGTFQGILQKNVSFSPQIVLLGVAGCFDATLVATDC